MLALRHDVEAVEKRLRELCASDPALGRVAGVVGPVAATALFAQQGPDAWYVGLAHFVGILTARG